MSRTKVVNDAATKLFREEAIRRVENRTNKELARDLAEKGIHLTPQYIGKLVASEIRRYRVNVSRADVSRGANEKENSSGTIG